LFLKKTEEEEEALISAMKCYYSCGELYLLIYRYSLSSICVDATETSSLKFSNESLNDLEKYLQYLNGDFDLNKKINENLKNKPVLDQLNRFQLLNVYAANLSVTSNYNKDTLKHIFNYFLNTTTATTNGEEEIIFNSLNYILPLISSDDEQLVTVYTKMFNYLLVNVNFKLSDINMITAFDDKTKLHSIFLALFQILSERSIEKNNILQLLNEMKSFVSGETNQIDISRVKRSQTMNSKQSLAFYAIVSFIPAEFISSKLTLILFYLNERSDGDDLEAMFNLYFKIFNDNLMQELDMNHLNEWIINLMKTSMNGKENHFKDVFDKIIKKYVIFMIREKNHQKLIQFTDLVKLFSSKYQQMN
jgi:hypothetical protein